MGRIVTNKLNDNVEYDVILPVHMNDNTQVILYSCTIDALYDKLVDSIANSGINAVVVIPKPKYWLPYDQYSEVTTNMINAVKSTYSIEKSDYISNGFSQQAYTAMKTKINYLQNNPNSGRQLILLNDGVPLTQDKNNGNIYDMLTDSDIKVLEENNSFIVDYCQENKWMNLGNRILNSNLDILFISDKKLPSTNFWTNHSYVYYNSYSSELYNKVLDFVYGDGDLPEEGFTYRLYNHQTRSLEEYSAREIKEKLNLTLSDFKNVQTNYVINYAKDKLSLIQNSNISTLLDGDNIIKSDLDYVKGVVKNIENSVKTYGSILENGLSSKGYESTTRIPSEIANMIEKYSVYNTNLIYKLNTFLVNTIRLALTYKDIDDKFSKDVEEAQEEIKYLDSSIDNSLNKNINVLNNISTSVKEGLNNSINVINVSKFLEYDTLCSDSTKMVFKVNDSCKLVAHKVGNNVTNVEYYYKYSNNDMAHNAYNSFVQKYSDDNNIDKVLFKDNIVKVIYNMNTFRDTTVNAIKYYFNSYEEILKQGD